MKKNNLKVVKIDKNKSLFNYEKKILIKELTLDLKLGYYDFEKAKTIVSIGADFLGDWQAGGFDAAYAKGRVPKNGSMSRHIQFESNMTLSGANADKRVPLKPSHQKRVLARLYGKLTGTSVNVTLPANIESAVDAAARELLKSGANGVVITGI